MLKRIPVVQKRKRIDHRGCKNLRAVEPSWTVVTTRIQIIAEDVRRSLADQPLNTLERQRLRPRIRDLVNRSPLINLPSPHRLQGVISGITSKVCDRKLCLTRCGLTEVTHIRTEPSVPAPIAVDIYYGESLPTSKPHRNGDPQRSVGRTANILVRCRGYGVPCDRGYLCNVGVVLQMVAAVSHIAYLHGVVSEQLPLDANVPLPVIRKIGVVGSSEGRIPKSRA